MITKEKVRNSIFLGFVLVASYSLGAALFKHWGYIFIFLCATICAISCLIKRKNKLKQNE